MEIAEITDIRLYGDPIFSLLVGERYTDITIYQPDPREYLVKGKKYSGIVVYRVKDTEAGPMECVREIHIDGDDGPLLLTSR